MEKDELIFSFLENIDDVRHRRIEYSRGGRILQTSRPLLGSAILPYPRALAVNPYRLYIHIF